MLPTERPLLADLRNLASNRNICDVSLRGTDGRSVPAIRALLAARSEVFERMFFGSFSESSSPDVELDFASSTLGSVVRYCYSDGIEPLPGETGGPASAAERAREVVRLIAAADFFQIPGLTQLARFEAFALMMAAPSLACPILDEASRWGGGDAAAGAVGEVGEVALEVVRVRSTAALLPEDGSDGGAACLGPSALRRVVRDGSRPLADEITLFRAVKRWMDSNDRRSDEATTASVDFRFEECSTEEEDSPLDVAKELVGTLDLSTIAPSELADVVEGSGLASMQQLLNAFKSHALRTERKKLESCPKVVDQVLVHGAGVPEINGVYSKKECACGVSYTKSGLWEGQEVSFQVKQGWSKAKKSWWWMITANADGKDIAWFYLAVPGKKDHKAVPSITWQDEDGKPPCPVCVLLPGAPE